MPASPARNTADRLDKKINKQPRPQRQLPSEGMQHVNRRREHRHLWQHDAQTAIGKVILDREPHELRDAGALQRGLDQVLRVIRVEGAVGDDPRAVGKAEGLGPAGGQIAQDRRVA